MNDHALATRPRERNIPMRTDAGTTFWEPFARLRNEFDQLLDTFGARPSGLPAFRSLIGAVMPPLEMTKNGSGYALSAELPGMEPDDVSITLTDNVLRISGEKKESRDDKEQDYFVSERRYGAFERVLQVPDDIDPESIKASFKNGVLKIELKRDKKAGAAERKIPIKAG